MVARSQIDRATRLTSRVKEKKMSWKQFGKEYRAVAILSTMGKFFRNKKGLERYRQVHDEVRDSAYQDFMKATKSSIAGFFAAKARDKKSTYPDMRFKSKFAPSNTIEIRARNIKTIERDGQDLLRFHQTFFGFGKTDGVALHERLPELTMSVRLQRLREGEYYLIVPRLREFPQSKTSRVCAIDPGVRNFVTVYDPDGRTFSMKDSRSVLKKKFEAIDEMKSILKRMDNECKTIHTTQVRTKNKRGTKSQKTENGRFRYQLRRRIRFTSRKATRAVNDMHQTLSSWLAANYYNVLLPSFQTSEMVRRYFAEVATDAAPETSPVEEHVDLQRRKIRSPTARAMLAQAHYRFKMLLKYNMNRAGGRVIECGEEYTSKTCSSCGEIKKNLGGNYVFACASCHAVLDRDVNAAKNIFHKNMLLLG